MMSKIYIVLTYTGTFLARAVRLYTKKEYSHVSISLDKELKEMYSFGRLNPYNPFWGGFVHESPEYGTFKRFKNTKSKIFSLEIPDDQYKMIKKIITDIDNDRSEYKFNVLGLVAVMANMSLKREKCFYCAEFVKYVFDNTDLEINLPDVVKPDDFQYLKGLDEIYTGFLREYNNV